GISGQLLLPGLGAIARTGLLAVADAGGVEGAPDDLVADAGQVLHASPTDEHDRVLLQIVPDARDVGRDLDAAGQTDARDLPEGRIRLLRRGGPHARAHAAALRRLLERWALRLRPDGLAALPDQL